MSFDPHSADKARAMQGQAKALEAVAEAVDKLATGRGKSAAKDREVRTRTDALRLAMDYAGTNEDGVSLDTLFQYADRINAYLNVGMAAIVPGQPRFPGGATN